MLFNSFAFAVFLPVVFVLYWALPHKFRWVLMLVASYYFYMSWNAKYVALIATTTFVSYICAILIEKTEKKIYKRLYLIGTLVVSLGILYMFKYFDFSMDLIERFIPITAPRYSFLLPVGISFYTFQTLSYVIDVYKGEVKAEKNLGIYATFVSFFPQLVAGPIERTSNLMPQINSEKEFNYESAKYGVRLALWGLFKKMVIADNLAVWVDQVYGNTSLFEGCSLAVAAFFFSIQIYCDFSGYSDIARGTAKLLNIDLMENFRSPYFSASIKEFWSRWHISLSTWFRDYVYIPLGGNKVSKGRNIINYMITFLVSGLWHGANLTFAIWGGIHGTGQVCERAFSVGKQEKRDVYWIIRVICIFFFVSMTWVFFRASSINEALYLLRHSLTGLSNIKAYIKSGAIALGISRAVATKVLLLYLAPLFIYDFISLEVDICDWIGKRHFTIRYAYIGAIIMAILTMGYVGQSTFVYFQF